MGLAFCLSVDEITCWLLSSWLIAVRGKAISTKRMATVIADFSHLESNAIVFRLPDEVAFTFPEILLDSCARIIDAND